MKNLIEEAKRAIGKNWELYIGSGMSKGLFNFEHLESEFITVWFNEQDLRESLKSGIIKDLERQKKASEMNS